MYVNQRVPTIYFDIIMRVKCIFKRYYFYRRSRTRND